MTIRQSESSIVNARLHLQGAQPGDTFIELVSATPMGSTRMRTHRVSRVLVRDVVTVDETGCERRFLKAKPVRGWVDESHPELREFRRVNQFLERKGRAMQAMSILERGAGSEMDPEIIEALEGFLARHTASKNAERAALAAQGCTR